MLMFVCIGSFISRRSYSSKALNWTRRTKNRHLKWSYCLTKYRCGQSDSIVFGWDLRRGVWLVGGWSKIRGQFIYFNYFFVEPLLHSTWSRCLPYGRHTWLLWLIPLAEANSFIVLWLARKIMRNSNEYTHAECMYVCLRFSDLFTCIFLIASWYLLL